LVTREVGSSGHVITIPHNPILIKPTRILPLLSFSDKLIVTNLDELVGEFSSRGENAFVRRVEGQPSAADLEHSDICMALGCD
jgi:hypothetical protein